VLLVLLIAGFITAEIMARQYAGNYLRDRVISVLQLDPDTAVDVDFGPGSVILQAARGSINDVTIRVDTVILGDVTGRAVLTASSVPLDQTKPIGRLGVVVTISEDQLGKLAPFLSGYGLRTIELGDGVIRIGADFSVLSFAAPVSVDLVPAAVGGAIRFDPKTISLGGSTISVADLRSSPIFGSVAADLLRSRNFCVANYMPKALTLNDVRVVGSNLVLTINGDGTALADPNLSVLGACP
jgi:hypothetical protein